MLMAGLVNAFDREDSGNLWNIDEDGFELALVGNFQIGVNARIGAVGPAFEIVNVGTGSADDGSDFRKKTGTIARANGELNRKSDFGAAPLDSDAALGLVHEVLDVGTSSRMHRDAAAARDVADNFVARNGIATLGAVNEQVVVTFNA